MLALALVLAALQQPAVGPTTLPPQVGDTSPFRRLALPAPTLIREGSGAPGPRYWQQRADYTIRASLDTATHTIAGAETIRYTNNSPDTCAISGSSSTKTSTRRRAAGRFSIRPTRASRAAASREGIRSITSGPCDASGGQQDESRSPRH